MHDLGKRSIKKIIIEDILNPTSAVQDDQRGRILSTKKD